MRARRISSTSSFQLLLSSSSSHFLNVVKFSLTFLCAFYSIFSLWLVIVDRFFMLSCRLRTTHTHAFTLTLFESCRLCRTHAIFLCKKNSYGFYLSFDAVEPSLPMNEYMPYARSETQYLHVFEWECEADVQFFFCRRSHYVVVVAVAAAASATATVVEHHWDRSLGALCKFIVIFS